MCGTLRRSVIIGWNTGNFITNPTVTIQIPRKLYFPLINHARTGISHPSYHGNFFSMIRFIRIPHPFKDTMVIRCAWHVRLNPAILSNRIQRFIPWHTQPRFKPVAQGEIVIYQVNVFVTMYRRVRLDSIGKTGFLLTFPPMVISRMESALHVNSLSPNLI
jgi:hypothetical protein